MVKYKITLTILAVLIFASVKYFVFPSWSETYSFQNDKINIVLNPKVQEYTSNRANTLVIRLTGNYGHACGIRGRLGRPDDTKVAQGKHASQAVNELLQVSSYFTAKNGSVPFRAYKTTRSATPYLGFSMGGGFYLGSCSEGGAIQILIYKEGYDLLNYNPKLNISETKSLKLYKVRFNKKHEDYKLHLQIKRIKQIFNLLYPFKLQRYDREGIRTQNIKTSTLKYWQHVLPNEITIKEYAISELSKTLNYTNNQNLKKVTKNVIGFLSKDNLTPNDISEYNKIIYKALTYDEIAFSDWLTIAEFENFIKNIPDKKYIKKIEAKNKYGENIKLRALLKAIPNSKFKYHFIYNATELEYNETNSKFIRLGYKPFHLYPINTIKGRRFQSVWEKNY